MTTTLPTRAREMNPYLAKQVDALPGYRESLDLAAQARDRLATLNQADPVPTELHPLQTGTITEQWLTAVADHTADVARIDLQFRVLSELRRDADARAQGIYQQNVDTMLAGLNTDLQALLDEVDALAAELDGIDTPEAAIAADLAAQWRRLTALHDEYRKLRQAQSSLMAGSIDYVTSGRPTNGGEEPASDLHLRNLDTIWPTWLNPDHTRYISINGDKPRLEPWPTDPARYLLWLSRSEAEAWIPTRRQLDRLWQKRQDRANPNPTKVAGITPTNGTMRPHHTTRAGIPTRGPRVVPVIT